MSDTWFCKAVEGCQLSVFLVNQPGSITAVSGLLSDKGVNIIAFSLAEGLDHGYVRMVVDKPDIARVALTEDGGLIFERSVLLVEASNHEGSLHRIANTLSEAGVNVDYTYCASGTRPDTGLMVARVNDLPKAISALNDLAAKG